MSLYKLAAIVDILNGLSEDDKELLAFDWHRQQLLDAMSETPDASSQLITTPSGFALLRDAGDKGHIDMLYVRPASRGRGAGAKLLVRAMQKLEGKPVYVMTRPDNIRMQTMLESAGFKRVDNPTGSSYRYVYDSSSE